MKKLNVILIIVTIDDSYINSEKTKKESIKEILSKHKEFDELYLNFTEKRNELIKKINMLKETNKTNELINFENEIKMLDSLDFKKKHKNLKKLKKNSRNI
jgi:chorismate mutase